MRRYMQHVVPQGLFCGVGRLLTAAAERHCFVFFGKKLGKAFSWWRKHARAKPEFVRYFSFFFFSQDVTFVSWSKTGDYLALGTGKGTMCIYHRRTNEKVGTAVVGTLTIAHAREERERPSKGCYGYITSAVCLLSLIHISEPTRPY